MQCKSNSMMMEVDTLKDCAEFSISDFEQSLFTKFTLKPDQFDGIHVLDNFLPSVVGAPNFRQIPGFPLYATGQPSVQGMIEVINEVKREKENEKIIWFSMRQEPVVYLNNEPYALRSLEKPHRNLEAKFHSDQPNQIQASFVEVIKKKVTESSTNSIKISKDKSFQENPMDRVDIEVSLQVNSIESVDMIIEKCSKVCNVELNFVEIAALEDQAPSMSSFDVIINKLKDEPASTPCVFSCQMGKGRSTVGLVAALLIKEIKLTTEMRY